MRETLGKHAPSYATVKNWVAQFKRGDFSTYVAPRPGRHKTVTTLQIIEQINEIILEVHRISSKSLAEQLGISRERVGTIIHEDMDMRKLSAKWVPKCLNADQKRLLCHTSEQIWNFFGRYPNDFLYRLVSTNETWLYHYDPEIKQQSMEWRHSCSPRPKQFRVQKSAGKLQPRFFGDQYGILLIDYLPNGYTIKRGVLLISADRSEGHFEGKISRVVYQVGFVLARQCPGSPGTCNPEGTGQPGLPVS